MYRYRVRSVIAIGICVLMLAGCNTVSKAQATSEAPGDAATEGVATGEARDSAVLSL